MSKNKQTFNEYMAEQHLMSRTQVFTAGIFGAFLGALLGVAIVLIGLA